MSIQTVCVALFLSTLLCLPVVWWGLTADPGPLIAEVVLLGALLFDTYIEGSR